MKDHSAPYLDGWIAHRMTAGAKLCACPDANPYRADTQAFSAREWNRGWLARYEAVRLNQDPTLDDELDAL